ncbi:unnamed protein product [Cyprideis torosa]|uniref:Large ribosomal subunit protein bL19m n=1 Tax=Cyprideis torosa TaxID=163714 RepID=A0A7R8ZK81_9CRUS|nr:unnamed protein product [Cyprideis torosa]CAG0888745.1 unnamed protein product [Cyprideis torosa]
MFSRSAGQLSWVVRRSLQTTGFFVKNVGRPATLSSPAQVNRPVQIALSSTQSHADSQQQAAPVLGIAEDVTNPDDGTSPQSTETPKPNPNRLYAAAEYRYIWPEFLPEPDLKRRHRIREKLERQDMLRRRKVIDIPEFYIGTIMAVKVSDRWAPGKSTRFLGICIERGGVGLRAWFTLRNVVEGEGVQIKYEMYNPTIQQIEIIRLEKRLDDHLTYLRDAPAEYSYFPQDMLPEYLPEGSPIPVNETKVPLKPPPWIHKWYYWDLRGVVKSTITDHLTVFKMRRIATTIRNGQQEGCNPWLKYDLMRSYRDTLNREEMTEIYEEVAPHIQTSKRKQRQKRQLARPVKKL